MSSDSESFKVTYTSIALHGDPLPWAVEFLDSRSLTHQRLHQHHQITCLALRSQSKHRLCQIMFHIDSTSRYVADLDPEEDPEEESEEGLVDYSANGVDDDDDDDPSDDDEDEEAKEEEHQALADFFIAPIVDPVPSFEET
uniref:Uncharacterized protein n=1 Tax=Tanacetum cinerariifolium TaxID=118510 RepID=A0A699GKA7_TANCI|nr:hypothetical protein [Tanacetum cinerariifolium]